MKRGLLYMAVLLLLSIKGYTQINGGFYYGSFQGQTYVYFQGVNVSGKSLYNLKVYCVNEVLGQRQEYTLDALDSNGTFELGPANNWVWQPGEKLGLIYSNGQSVYWIYSAGPAITPNVRNYNSDGSNKATIRARISELEYKLRDAERSLRDYEKRNDKNPTVTGMMLINEQRKLIRTYQEQITSLTSQLY